MMEISNIDAEKNLIRIKTESNEETLFLLLKEYLKEDSNVDLIGVYKEHHLIDTTELLLKVKKGDAKKYLKDALKKIKKELEKLKVK